MIGSLCSNMTFVIPVILSMTSLCQIWEGSLLPTYFYTLFLIAFLALGRNIRPSCLGMIFLIELIGSSTFTVSSLRSLGLVQL